MKSRRKLKYRELPSKYNKVEDLEKKVEKAIKKANERIKSVSKKYKGTTYMWAVNKLQSKLGSKYFKSGRIKLPKKMKTTELINVYKEIESFMSSKESTKSGIKEIQEKAKLTMKNDLFEGDISDEDIDIYYSLLEDKDFTSLLDNDFGPSEFWVIIDDAIKYNDNQDEFIDRISTYLDVSDESVRNKAIKIYNRYVK